MLITTVDLIMASMLRRRVLSPISYVHDRVYRKVEHKNPISDWEMYAYITREGGIS